MTTRATGIEQKSLQQDNDDRLAPFFVEGEYDDVYNEDEDDDDVTFGSTLSGMCGDEPVQQMSGEIIGLKNDPSAMMETPLIDKAESTVYDFSSSHAYVTFCARMGIAPISYFVQHIDESVISLKHHLIGPVGVRAISVALLNNMNVTSLDLEDNNIKALGALYVSHMLTENIAITDLNLAANGIGGNGAKYIMDKSKFWNSLLKLNLSGNGFTDTDARTIARIIKCNTCLKELNISYNELGDAAGYKLGAALSENEFLEAINLSWNHFRNQSASKLLHGIQGNVRLKKVDLSWNGLGDIGAKSVIACLEHNHILLELDISHNRVTDVGAAHVAKGLRSNTTLTTLEMGNNPITQVGALLLLSSVSQQDSAITFLGLTDVWVNKEFRDMYQRSSSTRQFTAVYAGVHGDVRFGDIISMLGRTLAKDDKSETEQPNMDTLSPEGDGQDRDEIAACKSKSAVRERSACVVRCCQVKQ